MSSVRHIALIGYGEVGQILGQDLGADARLSAWDILFSSGLDKSTPDGPVTKAASAADAVKQASLVICAVTAAETLTAARDVAPHLSAGTIYVDMNSASPGTKTEAASLINAGGGRYIEAAVMSPVPPKRLGTPLLLGGPHAQDALPVLKDIGFNNLTLYAEEIGRASAAKMCRSVMVKGIEALLTESLLTARHYGVEDTVITSLSDLFPGPDWQHLSHYMISRSVEHGKRRAEEMREVARTVSEAGLSPLMSEACAERQDRTVGLRMTSLPDQLDDFLDLLLTANQKESVL